MSATEVTADVIADYLAGQELEYERFDERSFAVALPGEKRLKTACLLSVGTHALEIEAFVMRRPDENHEQVYAFLLQRNARMYAVSRALDATGDVYLTGRVSLDDNGDPQLDYAVSTFEGISPSVFEQTVKLWDRKIGDMKDYFHF